MSARTTTTDPADLLDLDPVSSTSPLERRRREIEIQRNASRFCSHHPLWFVLTIDPFNVPYFQLMDVHRDTLRAAERTISLLREQVESAWGSRLTHRMLACRHRS
jgi:hypothetical protein